MSVSCEGSHFPLLWTSKLKRLARKGDIALPVSMGGTQEQPQRSLSAPSASLLPLVLFFMISHVEGIVENGKPVQQQVWRSCVRAEGLHSMELPEFIVFSN